VKVAVVGALAFGLVGGGVVFVDII